MKKTISILLITFALTGSSYAQTIFGLSYEPATPLGDMTNFIGATSLRGLSGSANWFLTNKISAGLTVQWTGFYEKEERETWNFDGYAITANAWKEFYLWSVYANGKYQFKDVEDAGNFVPYIGLSVGTMYIDQNAQVGTYEVKEKNWRFAFAPEAGFRLPMGMEKQWGFNVMLRYQMAIYNERDISMLQFLNYSVGVYWKLWPRGERY